ncbi:uncharacterized protein LOC122507005 [Leptopilina heterotoma]|uniref:uncharacterized protein LOC122507005 n=1 Tax=Leptopilina heterotoma TaxID=63436 RepID=UPI001CA84C02|nr:uncharacterized protein LOC122507005 [Leptopilina heterotoma]
MSKLFTLIFTITIVVSSNADDAVNGELDYLLSRCHDIEYFIDPVKIEIQSRRKSLAQEVLRSRKLLNRQCIKAIEENNNRINQLLDDKTRNISELQTFVTNIRNYVADIKQSSEREIREAKQGILQITRKKENEVTDKVDLAKRLNIRFVTDLATPFQQFVFIQECYKKRFLII